MRSAQRVCIGHGHRGGQAVARPGQSATEMLPQFKPVMTAASVSTGVGPSGGKAVIAQLFDRERLITGSG